MLGAARWSLVPALVAVCLAMPPSVYAIVPQVRDGGKFFTPETVKKADPILLDIQKKHKKDVVVETFDHIPDDVLKKYNYDLKKRPQFFGQWAKEIANNAKVNGIVILICKDQKHDNSVWVEEEVGQQTREKAFTESDRKELHRIFVDNWNGMKNTKEDSDTALLAALKFINERMAVNHSPPPTFTKTGSTTNPVARSESDGPNILGWVCIGLCVLLGIWLIFGLIRAFTGGGGGYAGGGGGPGYGYGGGGGGGGGFMSGLMGGLFGAMAGNWIYNSMFGGHSYHQSSWGESSANAGESRGAGKDDFGPSDEGRGFAGGGGDVGGGDADADGGDVGGGGGGGGGGDDWGGGGGDWGGGGGGDTGGGGGDWGGGGGGGDWGGGGGGGDFGGGGGGGDW